MLLLVFDLLYIVRKGEYRLQSRPKRFGVVNVFFILKKIRENIIKRQDFVLFFGYINFYLYEKAPSREEKTICCRNALNMNTEQRNNEN